MKKFTAHTLQGIEQFDNELDAHMESHHTTNTKLISRCGVVVGLDMDFNLIVEMNKIAGCPEPVNCAHDSLWESEVLREALNKSITY